jgi:hypothetical protein
MAMRERARSTVAMLGLTATLGGCRPALSLDAPTGFAAAETTWRSVHFKASDNVGLKLLLFDNVEGGTLEYWGRDLEHKLTARGYVLASRSTLVAPNSIRGTRFDFQLATDDDDDPMFLVVGLFVTDDYRYVAQIAGTRARYAEYDARVPEILGELRPRGCRPRSKICPRSRT